MGPTSWILCLYLAMSLFCALDHVALECWVRDLLWKGAKEPIQQRTALGYRQSITICLSAIFIGVHSTVSQPSRDGDCSTTPNINMDIGGVGVLLGLTVPCGFLFVMLFLGHFKSETSGAKEICIGQIANLGYLAFNLAKSWGILNHQELIIACSSIDIVNTSISMSFSDKDVLAARSLVITAHIVQASSFVVEGVGLARLSQLPLSTCASSWHPMFNYPPLWLVWTYLAIRLSICLLLTPTLHRLAPRLHQAQNASKDGLHTLLAKEWESLSSTIFTNYFVFASIAAPHIFAVFRIRAALGVRKSWDELWSQWGQSAAFVIAIATILHVLYSLAISFSYKAHEHRRRVAAALKWSIKHEDSKTCKTWPHWLTLYHPFLTTLRPHNELLTEKRRLLTYEERRLFLTKEQRDILWEDILLGIRLNDIPGIHDCVLRGAPTDRKDEHGDTLLHIAARFGDKSLLRAVRTAAPSSLLLLQNDTFETPLEVATRASQVNTVTWILAEMMKDSIDEGNASVSKCFGTAIEAEKRSILFILTTWPDWEELEVAIPGEQPQNIFMFAIKQNKTGATQILLETCHSIYASSPRLQWLFEYVLLNGEREMVNLVSKHKPHSVHLDSCLSKAPSRGYLKELLDAGSDPKAIMISCVEHAEFDTIEELLDVRGIMPSLGQAQDYVLTLIDSWDESEYSTYLSDKTPEWIAWGKRSLFQRRFRRKCSGGRSWHNFHKAAKTGDYRKMESMMESMNSHESERPFVYRMVNCRGSFEGTSWNSVLHMMLDPKNKEPLGDIEGLITDLIKHGLIVTDQNSRGETALDLATWVDIPANIFLLLLNELPRQDINMFSVRGHTLLHLVCQNFLQSGCWRETMYIENVREKLIHLRHAGANPLVKNKISCKTSLDYLSRISLLDWPPPKWSEKSQSAQEEPIQPIPEYTNLLEFLSHWEHEYRIAHNMELIPLAFGKSDSNFVYEIPRTIEETWNSSDLVSNPSHPNHRRRWGGLRVEMVGEDDFNWISPS